MNTLQCTTLIEKNLLAGTSEAANIQAATATTAAGIGATTL
jgi:hypothetical protein